VLLINLAVQSLAHLSVLAVYALLILANLHKRLIQVEREEQIRLIDLEISLSRGIP
jgi:hypothetical protein